MSIFSADNLAKLNQENASARGGKFSIDGHSITSIIFSMAYHGANKGAIRKLLTDNTDIGFTDDGEYGKVSENTLQTQEYEGRSARMGKRKLSVADKKRLLTIDQINSVLGADSEE